MSELKMDFNIDEWNKILECFVNSVKEFCSMRGISDNSNEGKKVEAAEQVILYALLDIDAGIEGLSSIMDKQKERDYPFITRPAFLYSLIRNVDVIITCYMGICNVLFRKGVGDKHISDYFSESAVNVIKKFRKRRSLILAHPISTKDGEFNNQIEYLCGVLPYMDEFEDETGKCDFVLHLQDPSKTEPYFQPFNLKDEIYTVINILKVELQEFYNNNEAWMKAHKLCKKKP